MSAAEQVQFLLACIKHSSAGGKIDFAAVATNLNIPTKAAAAKRYERLKKRAQATDFGACPTPGDGSSNADEGEGDDLATAAGEATPTPKPKRRTPAKPRAKGKGKASIAAGTSDAIQANDAGLTDEANAHDGDASAISSEPPKTPVSAKRKRVSDDDAFGNPPDTDNGSASEAAAGYTGSRFIAVNATPTRQPVPKRAKAQLAAAAIKTEADTCAKEDEEDALAAVKHEQHEGDEGL